MSYSAVFIGACNKKIEYCKGGEVELIVITTMNSLPEHCYECPCHDGESGYCQADKEQRYSDYYRPFWCPLIRCDDYTNCAIEKHFNVRFSGDRYAEER